MEAVARPGDRGVVGVAPAGRSSTRGGARPSFVECWRRRLRAPELEPWLDLVAVRGEVVVQFWLKPGEAAVTLGSGEERASVGSAHDSDPSYPHGFSASG